MPNAANGLTPSSWGPAFWHVLYVFAANYKLQPTAQDKLDAAIFLRSVSKALPCRTCRENFPRNAHDARLSMAVFDGRDELFSFVYRLHECVTDALGRKMSFTCDEARQLIERSRATCNSNSKTHSGCQALVHGTVKPKLQMSLISEHHGKHDEKILS